MGTKYISRKRNRRGNLVKYRDDRLVTAQQSTGAAQIANLKYILKNGSTGEFVEALDSIINERIRVALGTLVNNLDKGTGLAKVLGIDSSNDLGASSLANLASMLSANIAPLSLYVGQRSDGVDVDNKATYSSYVTVDTDMPAYGMLVSFGPGAIIQGKTAGLQFLASYDGSKLYYRIAGHGVNGWSSWKEL